MSFCDSTDPGWLNQPSEDHVNSCGLAPSYNDYGSNPHTDSCNDYNGYADTGGLPTCPGAYQGTFHVDNSVCHSNTAFSDFGNHYDVPHGDYCDTYQQWTDSYGQWSNYSQTAHVNSGGSTCLSVNTGYFAMDPCSSTYCSSSACGFTQWWGNYFCNSSFCNSHPNYYCWANGYCFSNTTHYNTEFIDWSNHTDHVAEPHADGCSSHANYAYTQWSNYQHTSHKNFCNHSDSS